MMSKSAAVAVSAADDKDVALRRPCVWDWCVHCREGAMVQYFGMLSTEERQLKYPQGKQHHVLPWRAHDRQWLESVGIPSALSFLQHAHPWFAQLLCTTDDNDMYQSTIQIIRTRKSVEFGLPFTLCAHTIFSSTRPSVRTLVHELVHIAQRRHPQMMQHVYESMGWTVIRNASAPTPLRPSQMILHNPDTAGPTFAIRRPNDGKLVTSLLVYNCTTRSISDVVVKVSNKEAAPTNATKRNRRSSSQRRTESTTPAWQAIARVQEENQDIHPNEVMAYDIARGV